MIFIATPQEAAHWLLRTMDGQTDGWRKPKNLNLTTHREIVDCRIK